MNTQPRKRLEASSWFAVVRAYQACHRRYVQLLREFDMTVPQFDALTAIDQLDEHATPMAIAERLVVTRGNITGVLRRLQDSGLMTTHNNEQDGRSFVCTLTRRGAARLQAARTAAAAFVQQQLEPFDNKTLRSTETLMNKMTSHLQTLDPVAIAARSKAQGRSAI